MSDKQVDEISGTETTGHEWDGIRELNTPLPRWWLWTFYATIVWSVGYVIVYPAWPTISGAFGYSSRAELAQSVADARAAQAQMLDRISSNGVSEIIMDEEMARFARGGGASLFKVNCSQCHGSGAAGAEGFPNLNDDEWIWGGTPEDIYTTIAHGIRFEDDLDTRFNLMPAFSDGILSSEQIRDVAGYVATLAGMEHDLAGSEAGAALFADYCAACHGEQAEGNSELGGPALNNAIWLYSKSPETIVTQIANPRHGVMPGWQAKLGDSAIKQLAVYVHGLGGGQ